MTSSTTTILWGLMFLLASIVSDFGYNATPIAYPSRTNSASPVHKKSTTTSTSSSSSSENLVSWPESITPGETTQRTTQLMQMTELNKDILKTIRDNSYFFGTMSQFFSHFKSHSEDESMNIPHRRDIPGTSSVKEVFESQKDTVLGRYPEDKREYAESLDTIPWKGKSNSVAQCPSKAVLGTGHLHMVNWAMRAQGWWDAYRNFFNLFDSNNPEVISRPNTVALIERLLVCSETYGTLIVVAIPPFILSGQNSKHFQDTHPYFRDLGKYNECSVCQDSRNVRLKNSYEINQMEGRYLTDEEEGDTSARHFGVCLLSEILELTKKENSHRLGRTIFLVGAYSMNFEYQKHHKNDLEESVPRVLLNCSIPDEDIPFDSLENPHPDPGGDSLENHHPDPVGVRGVSRSQQPQEQECVPLYPKLKMDTEGHTLLPILVRG